MSGWTRLTRALQSVKLLSECSDKCRYHFQVAALNQQRIQDLGKLKIIRGSTAKATGRQVASVLVLVVLVLTIVSVNLSLVQSSSANGGTHVVLSSASTMVGGELWLNDSYPFQSEAASSTILALPAVSTWLNSHNISLGQLRPYDSLWSSQGNPYDCPQGTVGFASNGTVYDDYDYILPNGTVIGVGVAEGSLAGVLVRIFTFPSQGSLSYLG